MYIHARDMGYHMAGMAPDAPMIMGMLLIVAGLGLSLYGLLPKGAAEIRRRTSQLGIRALDDAPLGRQHVALIVVLSFAVTIDVMKPTTLAFVAPGVAKEYGLQTAANPHGYLPVTLLPLAGITGTVVGSILWGWLSDRIGRRASILFAGMLFISTAICGAMPGFEWNLAMCFVMGIGAGGMLPIAFTLIVETVPTRHRGWLIVLVGGDIAGAYVITSWLAATLTPEFSWRILWLIGLPTGLILIALNHWIPESPRYLLATGRPAEAEKIMVKYGAAPRTATTEPTALPTTDTAQQGARGWLARTAISVVMLALAVGLLTYGFQFWVPTNLQRLGFTEVNADYILRDSALLGLPLTVVVALLYGFWNSRATIIVLCLATAASVLTFALMVDSLVDHPLLLKILLVIPLSGISSATAVITSYGSEIFPTSIRSRGAGIVAGATKLGGVLVLVLILAITASPSIAMTAVIGSVPLLVAVAVFWRYAPDTHRSSLEDISGTPASATATSA
uniref:MFS transporter n=1 Tax=Nocardia suismassiliense TaxID=2077092 RepID=UPI003F49A34E